jgi:pimeloyl-ACP methyl ester carboxylesterase
MSNMAERITTTKREDFRVDRTLELTRMKGITRAALAGLWLVTASLAITGALYEMIGRWRDAQRFPHRGHIVQAGSIRMNIDCSGQGSPTVILESGSGGPSVDWLMVQPGVAKFSRVCSYDRAGYGWSDSGPEPRSSLQIAHELKQLLQTAGEKRSVRSCRSLYGWIRHQGLHRSVSE